MENTPTTKQLLHQFETELRAKFQSDNASEAVANVKREQKATRKGLLSFIK
jgi:hypothetical protein